MIGDAAPFIAAALAGLSAHPSEGMRSPDEIGERAVALGVATLEAFAKRFDADPDSDRHPENRGEVISLRVVEDLVRRVSALETELGSSPPKGE